MNTNPHMKALVAFDPAKNLQVDERFNASAPGAEADTISGLAAEAAPPSESRGKEGASFKTGAPITADILQASGDAGTAMLIVANSKGDIVLLERAGAELRPVWSLPVGATILKTPAMHSGILYCVSKEGLLSAVDTGVRGETAEKGKKPSIIWQKRLPGGTMAEPLATGKVLIVASMKGVHVFEAYFRDSDNKAIGKPVAEITINGVLSSPVMDSGIIYVGSEEKKLHALGFGGGKFNTLWAFEAGDAIRMKPCITRRGKFVLAASRDGAVFCLTRDEGRLVWSHIVRSPVYSDIASAVIGNEEMFFYGADSGAFQCLDSSGKLRWEFKANGRIRTRAAIEGTSVYFGAEDNTLYALDAASGAMQFKFGTDGNINSSPLLIDDMLYIGSTDSFVYGVCRR